METVFTETTHALLFAWVARATLQQVGVEHGSQVLRLAVRSYGEQRGRRMAARARRDGVELNMAAYLAYTEYRLATDQRQQELSQSGQDLAARILRCPWNEAWSQNGLGAYGRLYCREIDQAVLRGFNPALSMEVGHTLSNDGLPCEFIFTGGGASPPPRPSQPPIQSWEYHCGHLYAVLYSVLKQELGEAGLQAAQAGLQDLAAHLGPEVARVVPASLDLDFDVV